MCASLCQKMSASGQPAPRVEIQYPSQTPFGSHSAASEAPAPSGTPVAPGRCFVALRSERRRSCLSSTQPAGRRRHQFGGATPMIPQRKGHCYHK